MPVQLTTAATITDQLSLLAQNVDPSEMEIQRVKRDIDKLRTVSPLEYYMLLGMFHSVLGNHQECRENHERSLRISNDEVVLLNYAHSLRRLGLTADALPILFKAFDTYPTETVFAEIAQTMLYSGDLREYQRVLDKFVKANPDKDVDAVYPARYLKGLLACLDRADVSHKDFHAGMKLFSGVLVSLNSYSAIEAVRFTSGNFETVSHIAIKVMMSGRSVETLVKINEQIADAMADAYEIEAWDRLIISVSDYTEDSAEVA